MKTFKQHIKEGQTIGVGTTAGNEIEDGAVGLHNIQDSNILEKVNGFVGSIADREYLNPQAAVDQLREKLKSIGLTVSPITMEGKSGTVNATVSQFGGRFGKDLDGSDINDDGISHKKEGGLKLEVKYETLQNGTSKVYAKLV